VARTTSELTETVKLIERAHGHAQAFSMDVTDSKTVANQITEVERSLGPVDLLVNNAGTVGPICPLWESDLDEWWRVLDVNLRGSVLTAHALLPGMISRHRGRIVNIVSRSLPFPYLSGYITSKTALIRLTEILAAETKAHGVSLFSLAPGTVRTAMSEHSLDSAEGQKWIPWFRRIFDEGLDLTAERAARFVVELASGRADALSGRFLSVADDLDALLGEIVLIEKDNLYSLRARRLSDADANRSTTSNPPQADRSKNMTLRNNRTLAAPSDRVFRVWTDLGSIKQWFGYKAGVHWSAEPTVDAKVGGDFRWSVVSNDSEKERFSFHGTYRELRPPEKLVFTWEWESLPILGVEGPGKTLVTIELVDQGHETVVVLTQTGLPSEAARDAHEKGWNRCLDGIEYVLQAKP